MIDPKEVEAEFKALHARAPKSPEAYLKALVIAAAVRDAQRRYFRDRNADNLARSKAWEKLFDDTLKRLGIQPPAEPGSLFS